MRNIKYSFINLRKHGKDIRLKTTRMLREQTIQIDQSFFQFDDFISELEKQPASLDRNVKLMLACKMLNHIYSGLVLAENGLIVDAINCERHALETMAFYWLLCEEPKYAEEYEKGNVPRPVEVRKKLEQLGIDVTYLREFYAFGSEIAHVGRKSERFSSKWETSSKGELLFGGDFSPDDQNELFRFLPKLLLYFINNVVGHEIETNH